MGIGSDFEPSALASHIFTAEGVKSFAVNTPLSQHITELQIARLGTVTLEQYFIQSKTDAITYTQDKNYIKIWQRIASGEK